MDLVYTRALYPPGGEHLGKNPTEWGIGALELDCIGQGRRVFTAWSPFPDWGVIYLIAQANMFE
jgi:hypothetical protein